MSLVNLECSVNGVKKKFSRMESRDSNHRNECNLERNDSVCSKNQLKTLDGNDRRVLVIYTGGTIGMVCNEEGGEFLIYFPSIPVTMATRKLRVRKSVSV